MSSRITVKVIPGAAKQSVEWFGEGLKVKVTKAPEKGRANKAVIELLAERLGIPVTAITLISGHTSQQKLVEINGVSFDHIKKIVCSQ